MNLRAWQVLPVGLTILLFACSARDTPKKKTKKPKAQPHSKPVALFVAPDRSGRKSLFQLPPRGGEPTTVLGTEHVSVISVAVSEGGTAVALLVMHGDGDKTLRLATIGSKTRSHRVQVDASSLGQLRAVSDDGQTIVTDRGGRDLVVYQLGGPDPVRKLVAVRPLGDLVYGVALARNGSRLAFSAMKRSCASGLARHTCPVGLYGVDLRAKTPTPKPIAVGDKQVSYDPWFITPDGKELSFLSSIGDTSERCRKSVNHCTYSIHRVAFAGGAKKTVVERAVMARYAPDGTLSFRRRFRGTAGFAAWNRQSLHLQGKDGKTKILIQDHVQNRYHYWSPDSRWILLQTRRDGDHSLDVVTREGSLFRPGIPGKSVFPTGWSIRALPPGKGRLQEPKRIAHLREALTLARTRTGAGQQIGLWGVDERARDKIKPNAQVLRGADAVKAWLAGSPRRVAVVSASGYCVLHRQIGSKLEVVATVDNRLVVLSGRSRPALPPPKQDAEPLAVFDNIGSGGGRVALLGFRAPKRVQRFQRFQMTLIWKILKRPTGAWKVFVHFDGRGSRFPGDHQPSVCGTRDWPTEGVVADSFDVQVATAVGAVPPGRYAIYVGWYSGGRRAGVTGRTLARNDRARIGHVTVK